MCRQAQGNPESRSLGEKWLRGQQFELQNLIQKQGAVMMKDAVRCLCLMVRHLTHDTNHIVSHLNYAMGVTHQFVENCKASGDADKYCNDNNDELDRVKRCAYIVCNILNMLDLDQMLSAEDAPPLVNGLPQNPSAIPRFNFKMLTYAPVGGSISNSVSEIMCDLYNLEVPKLQYHLIMPLGFFLSNHRTYIKSRRVLDIFRHSLGSQSFLLRNMGLTMLRDILMTFEKAALTESVTGGQKKEEEEAEKKNEEQKGATKHCFSC